MRSQMPDRPECSGLSEVRQGYRLVIACLEQHIDIYFWKGFGVHLTSKPFLYLN